MYEQCGHLNVCVCVCVCVCVQIHIVTQRSPTLLYFGFGLIFSLSRACAGPLMLALSLSLSLAVALSRSLARPLARTLARVPSGAE